MSTFFRLGRRRLAILAVVTAIMLLAPQATLAEPASPPTSPIADPSNGLLPDEASGKAVEMIGEKVVSQGGRYHNIDDARVPPTVSPMAAAASTSGDYRIDSLLSGFQWTIPTITYSFYSNAVFNGSYYGTETGIGEVSDAVKANVRQIMAWYGTLLNVNFVEVQETPTNIGLIRILTSVGAGYAYTYFPIGTAMFAVAGDVILDPTFDRLGDTNGFQHPAGKHGYATLIHELGHALGLKHPHSDSPVMPALEDNDSNTVMSYKYLGGGPGTPMVYDIMALQFLYGARPGNTGSESYGFTSRGSDQYNIGSQLFLSTPYAVKQAIWDSAGYNTLDFTILPASSSGYRLDLKGGGWLTTQADYLSNINGTCFYTGTALGATMSVGTVVNSSSSDVIFANPSPNIFKGYSRDRVTGLDVIYDADSADTLDLSGYSSSEVTRTQSGNDLVLGLGTNGSVTLKDYYLGKQPQISFSTVVPPNMPPTASITATPTTGYAPLSVSFDGSGSNDPDGTIASFSWSFGDGTGGTGATVQHSYAGSGSYTATLTVTDDQGATGSASVGIAVQALPSLSASSVSVAEGNSGTTPAVFMVSLSAPSASTVTVLYATADGTASAASDYVATSGTLSFAAGETSKSVSVAVIGDTVLEPNETFYLNLSNSSGATVAGGQGTGTILNDDQAPNVPPFASATASPLTGSTPLTVTFDGSGSTDSDGTITSYAWNFGDGATGTGSKVQHSYATPGSYSAVLTVTDNAGATATASVVITVQQAPAKVARIGSMVGSVVASGRNGKAGQVVVTVTDLSGAPVAGATVAGKWAGLASGSSSGTTGADGGVTLISKSVNKSGTLTFAVTGVTPPGSFTYDARQNSVSSVSIVVPK